MIVLIGNDGAHQQITTEFIYTYDFGDDWRHRIQVEAAMEPEEKNSRPLCVAGANAVHLKM